MSTARRVSNLLITLLVGPGIVAHELSHHLACRLLGVEVAGGRYLNPLADDAYLDHERVNSLVVDIAIAFAPLAGNTVLAVAAFAVAGALAPPVAYLPLWLGACFGLTAFPSGADTSTFLRNVRNLPAVARPAGYLLAGPLRAGTRFSWLSGLYGFVWTAGLYDLIARLAVPG